nr:hypothetical protein [Tanacetum cinerariifolium]
MFTNSHTLLLIIQHPNFNFSLFIIITIIMELTFANTHNMIAFLTKSDASDEFEQIIDFLNTHVIKCALMTSSRLDDVDSVDCLPNDEIFAELARIGYEKPSTKLTFYKEFFSDQWKFLIHTILQCMSAKRTAWNEFSSSMASAVICLATVGDLSSHTTKYTSHALTQKVFANRRRVGKSFSVVDTPLFYGMLGPQQAQDVEDVAKDEYDVNEVSDEPTPPSPTPVTPPPPPQQEHIPSPPQAKTTQPSPPPQQQPLQTDEISMTLLNQLLETCDTLIKQVSNLEQDKVAQAIEITKLKQRDTDEAEPTKVEEVIEVVTAAKLMTKVVTTAATTITVAQVPKASAPRRRKGVVIQDPEETATTSVIVDSEVKSKDKGKGILVEEPKSLKRQAQIEQDKAFARELEAELNVNINWNDVVDHVKRKEKQDNTVMRYQALKRKPITKAHARKNTMVYLKNTAGFKMDFFIGMTYTDIRPIFEKHK